MKMNKLMSILATTGIALAAACPADKDEEGTSNQTTLTIGDDGDDSGTATGDDGMSATMPMEDTMSPESSGGPESTGGSECTVDDECMTDAMCPGGMCIGCICVGGDDTGTDGDPYPQPNPGCPPGYGSIDPTQVGGGVCAPPCEAMFTCPEPTSGTAMGACALVEPGGSMAACEMVGEACETKPEICLMFAEGLQCSNPPAWCYLSCMGGAVCPDGQECGPQMICVWPD
jgi:hypothetical protein